MAGLGDSSAAALCPRFRFEGSVSVFFPAYNDAPSLAALLARTFAVLGRCVGEYEVIVVNDGSQDDTARVLEELREQYAPLLRVVTHTENLGYGAALRSGFAAATKEYVFYTDGDGQYDPAELENLLRAVTPETGLVNGYKIERHDSWYRIAVGWLYNRFARALFRIRLRDIDCDFRLIRRSALDQAKLQSTGGAICVELVRAIETSGAQVIELPVHHYARRHGQSQFFRVRSLAITFAQLFAVFGRLVLLPALSHFPALESDAPRPGRMIVAVALVIAGLALAAYGWALRLPFIADDYIQIQLARNWGPIPQWPDLARDALYRSRATSLLLTYWIDSVVGMKAFYFNLASLSLHIANAMLVFALGFWKLVGWRVSAIAAAIFAIGQRKSEAIVWFSAVPELLVALFGISSFLLFVGWLQSGKRWMYALSLVAFAIGLASKESGVAVAALCVLSILIDPRPPLRRLWGVVPFFLLSTAYFALIYAARDTHLHFNDGTFSLSAPVVEVLARSSGQLLGVWGIAFLPVLFATRDGRVWRSLVILAAAWMLISLLPYSFVTYMPRVPSRHTYLASVGRSLLLAAGFLTASSLCTRWKKRKMLAVVVIAFVSHQCTYLWFVKQKQYANRALPTEHLLRIGTKRSGAIHASCFPYSPFIADAALKTRGMQSAMLVTGPQAAKHPDAINFCNKDADGQHY